MINIHTFKFVFSDKKNKLVKYLVICFSKVDIGDCSEGISLLIFVFVFVDALILVELDIK